MPELLQRTDSGAASPDADKLPTSQSGVPETSGDLVQKHIQVAGLSAKSLTQYTPA